MQQILPCFYSEYGRYINRFRMIPYFIDALKPVERRLLLSLFRVAKDKKVKSAKVIGTTLAHWHPHGDASTYGALVKLVQNGFVEGRGNWGGEGLNDAKPAAYRYTECKLAKWVKDLAFRYIEYVPWEILELDAEPLYLPSPIPLGLIGNNIITGISFYTTTIPQYKLSDLVTRLMWLLDKNSEEETSEPIIVPNAKGCVVQNQPDQFQKILKDGEGSVVFIPDGEVRQNSLIIKGRAPGASFKTLKEAVDDSHPKRKRGEKNLDVTLVDLPGRGIRVEVMPDKKNQDLRELIRIVWTKYLRKNVNFNNMFVYDESGRVKQFPLDEILLINYDHWKQAVLKEKLNRFAKACQNYTDNMIIQGIRQIVEENTSMMDIQTLITLYNQKFQNQQIAIQAYRTGTFVPFQYKVGNDDIERITSRRSIRSLVEHSIDLNAILKEIKDIKGSVTNNDRECYDQLKLYL